LESALTNNAFTALQTLANANAAGRSLPIAVDSAPRWSGVGFSLLGQRFVAPIGQVTEIMEVPVSTTLPGVQSWVIGLSNVRGRLLPLFNLGRYFGGQMSGHKKDQRVLVLETDVLYSGLVVDAAFGMQHFDMHSFDPHAASISEKMLPFVDGQFKSGSDEIWSVFSVSTLSQDKKFINASI